MLWTRVTPTAWSRPGSGVKPAADVTGLLPPDGVPVNVDQWDGYTADRREPVEHLHAGAITNTVFLTGDIYSSWPADLPLDAGTYPLTPSPPRARQRRPRPDHRRSTNRGRDLPAQGTDGRLGRHRAHLRLGAWSLAQPQPNAAPASRPTT